LKTQARKRGPVTNRESRSTKDKKKRKELMKLKRAKIVRLTPLGFKGGGTGTRMFPWVETALCRGQERRKRGNDPRRM